MVQQFNVQHIDVCECTSETSSKFAATTPGQNQKPSPVDFKKVAILRLRCSVRPTTNSRKVVSANIATVNPISTRGQPSQCCSSSSSDCQN